ncbi:unnamed protein product, partial [Symbiodinium necroappetens]
MAFEVVFDEKVKKLGFELGLEEDDRPHVSGVKPGGAAIALGVRAGDILVTINGAPVGKPSREEIKALLKVRPLTLQSAPESWLDEFFMTAFFRRAATATNSGEQFFSFRKGCKRRLRERNKHLVLESGAEVSDSGSESDGQAWNIQQSVPKTRQTFVKLRIVTMRVRVSCDASAGSLRFLLRVPRELELVADFVRHLHLRLPQQATSLVLRVGGFALLPTLRLTDVLRDDDEVCVTVTGSDERPPIQSSVPMAALPDSAAPVAPAEKRRPKDAGNEDVPTPAAPAPSKARKEKQKPKVALVTSKQAAAEARQVLARSRQPSEEPQDEDMQQARSVNHPLLGELEVPPGQRTEEFVNRKLRTLKKAIRRQ